MRRKKGCIGGRKDSSILAGREEEEEVPHQHEEKYHHETKDRIVITSVKWRIDRVEESGIKEGFGASKRRSILTGGSIRIEAEKKPSTDALSRDKYRVDYQTEWSIEWSIAPNQSTSREVTSPSQYTIQRQALTIFCEESIVPEATRDWIGSTGSSTIA